MFFFFFCSQSIVLRSSNLLFFCRLLMVLSIDVLVFALLSLNIHPLLIYIPLSPTIIISFFLIYDVVSLIPKYQASSNEMS